MVGATPFRGYSSLFGGASTAQHYNENGLPWINAQWINDLIPVGKLAYIAWHPASRERHC